MYFRSQLRGLRLQHLKDVKKLEKAIKLQQTGRGIEPQPVVTPNPITPTSDLFPPIGHVESVFKSKNGTPRQPTVCAKASAKVVLDGERHFDPKAGVNPCHALEIGLR